METKKYIAIAQHRHTCVLGRAIIYNNLMRDKSRQSYHIDLRRENCSAPSLVKGEVRHYYERDNNNTIIQHKCGN